MCFFCLFVPTLHECAPLSLILKHFYAMILRELSELTINSDELNSSYIWMLTQLIHVEHICQQNQLQQIEYSFQTKLEIVFVTGPAK